MKNIGWLLIPTGLLLMIPWACQKNYSVSPIAPVATPPCSTPPQLTTPCTTGICWEGQVQSDVYNGSYSYYGDLYLAVNGAVVTNAGVTLTGTGIAPAPLVYKGTTNIGGMNYAEYTSNSFSATLPPGGTYTLTSVTSIGTATASLTLPSYPTQAIDGSGATWSGPSQFNYVAVSNGSSLTYNSGTCYSVNSPFSVPSSAYPAPGGYYFGVERFNYTSTITGGSGVYYVGTISEITLTK